MGGNATPDAHSNIPAVDRRDTLKLGATSVLGAAMSHAATGETVAFFHEDDDDESSDSSDSGGNPRDDRIHDFAHWAADLDLRDVPNDVVRNTERQIGNVIAAAAAGQAYGELSPPTRGSGVSVIGGQSANLQDAIWANAMYGIRNDFGSYQFAGHSVHGSVFSALAVSEAYDLSAKEFVENVIVANEFSGRLGGSVLVGPNNGQMVASIHAVSAAIVSARAQGGGAEEISNAVRMALFSPNNPQPAGLLDGHAKTFNGSIPSVTGVRIGDMAVRGGRGAARALENFHKNECFLPFPELIDAWGETWVSRSLCFKPLAGAAYVLPPLQAFNQVLEEEGINPDEVEEINVDAPILATATEGLTQEFAPDDRLESVGVNYSIGNTLALRAVDGAVTPENLRQANLDAKEDGIRSYAAKVTANHEWEKTVDTLDALARGIDFTPLIMDTGLVDAAMAVGDMRRAYDTVDTEAEALSLLASWEADDLLAAVGQLGWDEFDMAKADFHKSDFTFPCTVEVVTETSDSWWGSDTSYSRSWDDHEGASSRPESNKRAVVREKFEKRYGDNFDVIEGLHNRDLYELTNLL